MVLTLNVGVHSQYYFWDCRWHELWLLFRALWTYVFVIVHIIFDAVTTEERLALEAANLVAGEFQTNKTLVIFGQVEKCFSFFTVRKGQSFGSKN